MEIRDIIIMSKCKSYPGTSGDLSPPLPPPPPPPPPPAAGGAYIHARIAEILPLKFSILKVNLLFRVSFETVPKGKSDKVS